MLCPPPSNNSKCPITVVSIAFSLLCCVMLDVLLAFLNVSLLFAQGLQPIQGWISDWKIWSFYKWKWQFQYGGGGHNLLCKGASAAGCRLAWFESMPTHQLLCTKPTVLLHSVIPGLAKQRQKEHVAIPDHSDLEASDHQVQATAIHPFWTSLTSLQHSVSDGHGCCNCHAATLWVARPKKWPKGCHRKQKIKFMKDDVSIWGFPKMVVPLHHPF